MRKYECSRLIECTIELTADNDIDLKRKLGKMYGTPDQIVELADVVTPAGDWNVTQEGSSEERGIIVFTEEEIEHAVETEPEPWIMG